MSTFSPVQAATEGLRVIRRERGAFVGWLAIWTVALLAVAVLQLLTVPGDAVARAARGGVMGLVSRFGPFWPILVLVLLTLWTMNTASLYRAVLRPDEHGWHLFKLGADELRLALITALALAGLTALGSLPMLALYVLARPFFAVLPEFGRWIVLAGVLGTVGVELWIAVRLSLAPVHTFAEGRFHLIGYWKLTEHHFRHLLTAYALVALQILVLVVAAPIGGWLVVRAISAIGLPDGLDLFRRGLVFLMAVVLALIFAALFLGPLTLLSTCQARAYEEIVKVPLSPWGPAPAEVVEATIATGPAPSRLTRALLGVPLVGVAGVLVYNLYRRFRRDR